MCNVLPCQCQEISSHRYEKMALLKLFDQTNQIFHAASTLQQYGQHIFLCISLLAHTPELLDKKGAFYLYLVEMHTSDLPKRISQIPTKVTNYILHTVPEYIIRNNRMNGLSSAFAK